MKKIPPVFIVLGVTILSFLLGGGWHFLKPGDDFVYGLFYRLDSREAEISAWTNLLLFCGPAAAIAGAGISIAILTLKKRRDA